MYYWKQYLKYFVEPVPYADLDSDMLMTLIQENQYFTKSSVAVDKTS